MNSFAVISTAGSTQMGFGHLKRSIWLSRFLKDEYKLDTLFLVNKNPRAETILKESGLQFVMVDSPENEKEILENTHAQILFIDKRDTKNGFYQNLPYLTIGIDNYGEDAHYFDFLINPLPYLSKDFPANYKEEKYMLFPDDFWKYQKSRIKKNIKKILISFGGSDPQDLSTLLYQTFQRIKTPFEVQLILGPLYQGSLSPADSTEFFKIKPAVDSLYPFIYESDLVLTSFGITAYEASIIGAPVYLINPSDYHQELSRVGGFASYGVGNLSIIEDLRIKLLYFIENPSFHHFDGPLAGNLNFKNILGKCLSSAKKPCPVCGQYNARILKRKEKDNLYFCEKDKIVFRNSDYQALMKYDSNYFLDSYKNQYGKTYEEDRVNIDRLNQSRFQTILSLLPQSDRKLNLLEVGCALGFFLDMAEKSGRFATEGIEISAYGAAYAKNKLGLNVSSEDFLKTSFSRPYYDVLAMWYYIEHNQSFEKAILKIKEALKVGGILALSTPSCFGISARKDLSAYASRIPEDHYYEFSPGALQKLMEKNGFKLLKTKITGVHPGRWIKTHFKILNRLIAWWMRKKQMGDTFEVYYKRIQ
ncbi:MAG TPA: hypothetical protein DHW82_03320 [Spirochaetia bacterium]|nr:MAG: hypothetical protein A2Y41_02975 [Spirochaetes bacterium GWB1_36_13]HCL56023.1 hypothetical protein [Spirochaetia bacterium]